MNGHKVALDVPIIGEKIDREAIRAVEEILAKLRTGEIVNVAICGENRGTGLMTMAVSSPHGDVMRLRGAVALMGAMLDRNMLGGR